MTIMDVQRPAQPAISSGSSVRGGLLGRVAPGSRTQRALLATGVAAGLLFNAVYLVDGLLRGGYDSLRQPMSALSLGANGWIQALNFLVFGVAGCVTAFAWRPAFGTGPGAVWYPRLRVLAGLALIGAGLFSQDPGNGFPVGVPTPAHPSTHALVHQMVSFVSLTAVVAELVILARRLHREPRWRGWAPAALVAAVVMMACLATFGALMASGGPGGMLEKLASMTPTLYGLALSVRLLRGDGTISGS